MSNLPNPGAADRAATLMSNAIVDAARAARLTEREPIYREVLTLLTVHRFWMKRSEEEIAAVWGSLREAPLMLHVLIRALLLFRTRYEIEFGMGAYRTLADSVVEQSLQLNFADGDATLVDDQYRMDFEAMDKPGYQACVRINGWFEFLLVYESLCVDVPQRLLELITDER